MSTNRVPIHPIPTEPGWYWARYMGFWMPAKVYIDRVTEEMYVTLSKDDVPMRSGFVAREVVWGPRIDEPTGDGLRSETPEEFASRTWRESVSPTPRSLRTPKPHDAS